MLGQPEIWARLTVRQAHKADLPDLEWAGELSHLRRLFWDAYQAAQGGRGLIWVACLKPEGLVGQLIVSLTSGRPELSDGRRRAYIYGFRVQSSFRGLGIGGCLMDFAEADLRRRGFAFVTLNVANDNPDARRLYERRDYQVVAPEAGDWSYIDHLGIRRDVHEPGWRMEKTL